MGGGGWNCQDIVDAKLGETANPYADIMRTWGGGRVTPNLVLKWCPGLDIQMKS